MNMSLSFRHNNIQDLFSLHIFCCCSHLFHFCIESRCWIFMNVIKTTANHIRDGVKELNTIVINHYWGTTDKIDPLVL